MTHPLEFLQVCPKIGINVWKMRSPISKPNLGILKNSESDKARKNQMQNLILCDLKKNGPDSSSEAKVMVVLSLDTESGFLARCWKGGGVGFRDRIYFVDRVGCRDRIYFVDRVGFRDKIYFVDMVGLDTGSILWIWSV
jgi:hypothetical protein